MIASKKRCCNPLFLRLWYPTMITIKEIIDAAGGASSVAKRCNLTARAVYSWQEVGILDKYWPALIEMSSKAFEPAEIHQANLVAREAAA